MDRPAPAEYQPRLRWWSHAWRLVATVGISCLVWFQVADLEADTSELLWLLDVVVGLLCYVLVLFRRRWPVQVALVTAVAGAVSGIAAGPAVLAAVSVATHRRWRVLAVLGPVSFAAAQIFSEMYPANPQEPFWLTTGLNAIATVGILGWGMYIGSRRELMWTLKNRAERAEAEQELRVARSRDAERARIAREMHDVLAHRISQISMHAGALSFRGDLSADEMRESAAVIQEKAHEALDDLRGVLGVLRDEQGEPMHAPQPTYDDLPALVDEARGSGLNVQLEDTLATGAGEVLPDVVGRTVYRIVQEGITNVRKHAPGALLSIRLTGSPETGLDIELTNPLGFGPTRTPGSGLGLIGLAERAEQRGGRLEHRTDGSSFVLHGWIPWAA